MGSQGQQKSFLIALKLAQYDFLYTQKKRAPLLLLDDIFDKLDENRLGKVMDLLPKHAKGQIFITHTANLNDYFSAQDAQNFYLPDLICEKNTLIYP